MPNSDIMSVKVKACGDEFNEYSEAYPKRKSNDRRNYEVLRRLIWEIIVKSVKRILQKFE